MDREHIVLIESPQSWIEGEAVRQLERAAALLDVRAAAGMPDLHPGKGFPIGAAIATGTMLYPYLVGNDIGCGMGFWQTSIKARKVKQDHLVKRLHGLEGPWDVDIEQWLKGHDAESSSWDSLLGTIGGGNHFAELQRVHEILDADLWESLALDEAAVYLLVHSGSRGVGELILRQYVDEHRADGVESSSGDGVAYLERHNFAVRWAEINRSAIAARFLDACRAEGVRVLDLVHNSITRETVAGEDLWLHRKGAAPSVNGPVIIPGSRGTLTYLAMPVGDQSANLHSVAHGAGRKWNRSSAKDRLKSQYTAGQLLQTRLGGRVICEDKTLLFAEAPEAYKNIDTVVSDLQTAGLIKVVATLRPLITYKMRHEDGQE